MIDFNSSNDLLVFKDVVGVMPSKVEGSDIIEKVQNVVGNLNAEKAKQSLNQCCDVRGFSVFILGGLLEAIRENKWHSDYGYSSFKDMVEQGVGISTSAAYDYMKIYRCLIELGVSWEKLQHIGWTKIRWFAKYLTNENVDAWIQEAEKKNVEQLKQLVKQESQSVAQTAVHPIYGPSELPETSTQVDISLEIVNEEGCESRKPHNSPLITEVSALEIPHYRKFKMYPEQELALNNALEKAKKELPTEYETEALEAVCIGYLLH